MIVLGVFSPRKHDKTNGFSVLQSVCSYEGIVERFFLLGPWLLLFTDHLSY